MQLQEIHMEGFKSFATAMTLKFPKKITAIVGPNGSGKSNVVEAFRFVFGEQSMKSLRGRKGEDLICNGGTGKRSNRASVKVVFSGVAELLAETLDEVVISRTVYRDGTNEYHLNDTQVRQRDIVELLARMNVGTTGHHIISQGQADRILTCSAEERKEMIEDGLGLRLLQYRRNEAEKRLKKAERNCSETDLLIRELSPRLQHLKRQVKQYEAAQQFQNELKDLYTEYISREEVYLTSTEKTVTTGQREAQQRVQALTTTISEHRKKTSFNDSSSSVTVRAEEERLAEIGRVKHEKTRELGRIEGALQGIPVSATQKEEPIHREKLQAVYDEIEKRTSSTNKEQHTSLVSFILTSLKRLLTTEHTSNTIFTKKRATLTEQQKRIEKEIAVVEEEEKQLITLQRQRQEEQSSLLRDAQKAEQTLVTLLTEKGEAESMLEHFKNKASLLAQEKEQLQQELQEGAVLLGQTIFGYTKKQSLDTSILDEPRERQKERQRELERKKIRLETIGVGGKEEAYKEYEEVSQRVSFLSSERSDLLESIQNCKECIDQIQKELDERFRQGVNAINKEFQNLFSSLFNGGEVSIAVEKKTMSSEDSEEGEGKEKVGIGIKIALPRKKITSLAQLSGGERTLVSTALLFAISQVAPPPFLILDETDAALDEANASRYSQMLTKLTRHSQLILVTHNRVTMQHADVLYGITMNASGVSKSLSIQFEDAPVSIAS